MATRSAARSFFANIDSCLPESSLHERFSMYSTVTAHEPQCLSVQVHHMHSKLCMRWTCSHHLLLPDCFTHNPGLQSTLYQSAAGAKSREYTASILANLDCMVSKQDSAQVCRRRNIGSTLSWQKAACAVLHTSYLLPACNGLHSLDPLKHLLQYYASLCCIFCAGREDEGPYKMSSRTRYSTPMRCIRQART